MERVRHAQLAYSGHDAVAAIVSTVDVPRRGLPVEVASDVFFMSFAVRRCVRLRVLQYADVSRKRALQYALEPANRALQYAELDTNQLIAGY